MISIALCIIVVLVAVLAARMVVRTRIPGRVIESDGSIARPARVLRAPRYGLSGKPDFLVSERGRVVPVELKPTRVSRKPWLRDIVQLAAYCLLVEETHQNAAGYGYLRYANRTFRIEFTDAMRTNLLTALRDLRGGFVAEQMDRSHDDRRRCVRCPLRARCGQSLA